MKNVRLTSAKILAVVLLTSLTIRAETGNSNIGDREIPGDVMPVIPKFRPSLWPFPKFPKVLPDIQLPTPIARKARYSLSLENGSTEPLSCNEVKSILKEEASKNTELKATVENIFDKGKFSFYEVNKAKLLSDDFLNQMTRLGNDNVVITIVWIFENDNNPQNDYLNYYFNAEYASFHNFIIMGPDMRWEGNVDELPSFLEVSNLHEIRVKYRMSKLDFCFAEPQFTIRGKFRDEFSWLDPILKVEWGNYELPYMQSGISELTKASPWKGILQSIDSFK